MNKIWNAFKYFSGLTARNRLAVDNGFVCCRVSDFEGLEEVIDEMQSCVNFVAVSDTSQGVLSLENTPHTRRVKTIFLIMRHQVGDMEAREECFALMRELFRQFMSEFLRERTRLNQGPLFIDPKINLSEVDKYVVSGAACAYFQIACNEYHSLVYNPDEWLE